VKTWAFFQAINLETCRKSLLRTNGSSANICHHRHRCARHISNGAATIAKALRRRKIKQKSFANLEEFACGPGQPIRKLDAEKRKDRFEWPAGTGQERRLVLQQRHSWESAPSSVRGLTRPIGKGLKLGCSKIYKCVRGMPPLFQPPTYLLFFDSRPPRGIAATLSFRPAAHRCNGICLVRSSNGLSLPILIVLVTAARLDRVALSSTES
jgi:hypothetical protein